MIVLWITNITFPEAQALLTGDDQLKGSGGWMLGAAEALLSEPDIILAVASVSRHVNKLTKLVGKQIVYYVLPYGRGNHHENHDYEPLWREVYKAVKPDVVHIHGTEFSHSLAYLKACGADNVCISIQGLVSAYHYYYYGISRKEINLSMTPYSICYGGILAGYKDFQRRGKCEIESIRRVKHIIGRTAWDRDRVWAINPWAVYHYCGETLRKEFYSGETWSYNNCIPHSIFLSQGSSPFKGLHMLLRAMPLVLRSFPNASLRIAGIDITRCTTLKDCLILSDYGNFIRKLIRKYHLEDHVKFLGRLDVDQMRVEYLRSNVFVCPSSIENSPNSIGEAQILGVPVIASYAGGIPDIMQGDEEHLYRFEETEMLAHKINTLFEKRGNINTSFMRERAILRHDALLNTKSLKGIYREIMNG